MSEDGKKSERSMSGRKPAYESRGTEFRRELIIWKQAPESMRPSLRVLACELGTSHQLLKHYLDRLDEWERERKLEPLRANAKVRNVRLTPDDENRYLRWLKKIEERRARDRDRETKWAKRVQHLLDNLGPSPIAREAG